MAKLLIIVGLGIALLGALVLFFPGIFSWFGKLPGDVRIEKGSTFISFPVTTMILISVVLTVLLNLFFRR